MTTVWHLSVIGDTVSATAKAYLPHWTCWADLPRTRLAWEVYPWSAASRAARAEARGQIALAMRHHVRRRRAGAVRAFLARVLPAWPVREAFALYGEDLLDLLRRADAAAAGGLVLAAEEALDDLATATQHLVAAATLQSLDAPAPDGAGQLAQQATLALEDLGHARRAHQDLLLRGRQDAVLPRFRSLADAARSLS